MDIVRSISKRLYFSLAIVAIIVMTSYNSKAQICQGSLGEPIVNITFGSGPNPGPALSAATTNYTYVANDCPKDGFYAVRNRTDSCFDNLWYSVADHTGDANGYFMIVNASYDPGQFYLDTVRGLCSGNTYEFASWIINLSKPILCYGASQIIVPNITFRIEKTDGTILQSYNTNDISSSNPPQWKQFGFFFSVPNGVNEVVIRMINNAPGGCGNDLGLDDITFRPCGPLIHPTIPGKPSNTDTTCGGFAKTYNFSVQASPGYNNPTYQWQKNVTGSWTDIAGANASTYTANFPANTTAGTYLFRVLSAESGNINSPKCRVASQSVITIVVTPNANLTITSNAPVCEGTTLNLAATSAYNSISWSGPNNFSATGSSVSVSNFQSINQGAYYATTTNGNCNWKDSTIVQSSPKPRVIVDIDSAKICEGDTVTINASGAINYEWMPANGITNRNASTIHATPSTTTNYTVIGSNAEGCTDSAYVLVKVIRKPIANAGPDRNLLKGTSIQINASAIGDNITYYWTPTYALTGSQSLTPSVSPLIDTAYILHVESTDGCGISLDTMNITIYKNIVVPNAFSPNGDGWNDKWQIEGVNSYPNAEVIVFDRYGREVLRQINFQGWDGTRNGQPLPVGNYYYIVDLRNNAPKITGYVMILR